MNSIDGSSKSKKIIRGTGLVVLSAGIILGGYAYHKKAVYDSIKVVSNDTAIVEYGSANYELKDLVREVDGKIVSVKKDVNTNVVGKQEMVLEVKKENMVKEVPLTVSVVDTVAPEISIKEEKITITQGDEYDINENVESVNDKVDGALEYLTNTYDGSTNYYNYSFDGDLEEVGEHQVTVKAKDKYGNETTKTFTIEVEPKPVPVVQARQNTASNNGGGYSQPTYSGLAANAAGGDLVSIAYSLVGSPYVSGAAGPYAFDCSGFVHYVYSQVGIYVSRGSGSQAYDGVGVSYAEAQPGDILNWGHNGMVTHSALYVGGGMMIHATNPSQGVIVSSVAGWDAGSYDSLMGVRRIQ